MKNNATYLGWVMLMILAWTVSACSGPARASEFSVSTPAATKTITGQMYSDPFAYCAAIGTIDSPDYRYTGPQITDAIINGFKKAAGLESSTKPLEMFKQTTIWRCMNSQVYAC